MTLVSVATVSALDWAVLGLSGGVALASLTGAAYAVPWRSTCFACYQCLAGKGGARTPPPGNPRDRRRSPLGANASGTGADQRALATGFNTLWLTRALLQLLGAGYALALCLRLQVGDGV